MVGIECGLRSSAALPGDNRFTVRGRLNFNRAGLLKWLHEAFDPLLAVSQAPLRESAHQLVLESHLAEGNISEALRHYHSLSQSLWRELGIRPSEQMRSSMARFLPGTP